MKSKMNSSLYIFIIAIMVLSLFQELYGQKLRDSVPYYNDLILNPKKDTDLSNTYKFYNRYKDVSISEESPLNVVYALRQLAEIQKKLGFLDESEYSNTKALKILKTLSKEDSLAQIYKEGVYNHLGIIYRERKKYPEALNFYTQALEINIMPERNAVIRNNIGYTLEMQKKYDLALTEYKLAYESSLKYKNEKDVARSLGNLGALKSHLGYTDAFDILKEALSIREKINYSSGIQTSYQQLAKHFINSNDSLQASFYSEKALDVARTSGSLKSIKNAMEVKIENGEYFVAPEYALIIDSIMDIREAERSSFSFNVYQYEEKEKELKVSELKSERRKKMNFIYISFGVLILLTSIFLYYLLKSKHKKDKIRQAYHKETELSKKVHDELANDMSDLMSFVEQNIDTGTNKKSLLLDNIEDIYFRTRDISTETGSIDLIHFSESVKHLLMQHNKENTKVVINDVTSIDWQKIADHKKMIIYRCLQELLVNMKKHSKAKVVSVVFKEIKNKMVIRYVDDGIGFNQNESKLNGLLNVESRMKSIDGSFNFTTSKGNGFKAILEFNN